ncbi:MAG: acetyl-CoA carboxylase biotin carboxyl carrier protein [Planctomycetota bacterium]
MIDIRRLKELVKLMVENDLTELDLRDQEETVTVKRGHDGPVVLQGGQPMAMPQAAAAAPAAASAPAPAAEDAAPASGGGDSTEGLVAIESPIVGTFYSAPNPDSDPFVTAGASVNANTVVCLIEAMKVFNEIKAETSGTIERVCVNTGDAVEFGQTLFYVRPN